MYLQGKPPIRVGFHSLNTGLHIGFPLFFICYETRLQKTILSFYSIVLRQVLTQINHL